MRDEVNSAGSALRPAERRRQLAELDEIDAALRRGEPVRVLLHPRGALSPRGERLLALARELGVKTVAVGGRELRRIALDPERVEVLACLGPDPGRRGADLFAGRGAVWLLVGTAFPGNAGFVIRTAEVSGAEAVVIDADFDRTARRDAGRAAMRADRYLPVEFESAETTLANARAAGYRVIAVEDTGVVSPWEVDLTGPALFIVGGEACGVSPVLLSAADAVVRIPMRGFMSAYNLQAAMAAVMAERLRQEALRADRS